MRDPSVRAGARRTVSGDLDALESKSIFILREAFNRIDRLALLWSVGKDSNVLIWLARKAFFGRVPFPVMHVDTSYKMPEMIAFRDRMGGSGASIWSSARMSRLSPAA
jgi:3'-phosphoadenosine 5'-phosphosulfate sulfotransferase (PAPS reductase)/FAD synthetase